MAKSKIPRFISRLNGFAASHGLVTSASVGRFQYRRQLHLRELCEHDAILSEWRGTEQQFRATGLILPSYRFPLECGVVSTPFKPPWLWGRDHPLIAGTVELSRGKFVALLYGGHVPQTIQMTNDVEVCETSAEFIAHGEREALIAIGICGEIHFPRKRGSKSNGNFSKHHQWKTRSLPDGSFVHWKENDTAYAQRMADSERISREFGAIMARRQEGDYNDGPPITNLIAARQLLGARFSLLNGPKWDWSRSA